MRTRGFTLIELLVVMALIALLVSYVGPRYFSVVGRADEAVLRHNLFQIRDSLDKFYADRGRYPLTLDEIVSDRYLRAIPPDPFTGRPDTWIVVSPGRGVEGGVADVRSASKQTARDGSRLDTW
jgi:general secretion pathway protein G